MKIIFLDFDGVLNSETFFVKRHRNMTGLRMIDFDKLNIKDYNLFSMLGDIDMDNLDNLKEIIDKTGSKVVVISSWKQLKIFRNISEELIKLGIPIIDTTKDQSYNRVKALKII